METIKEAAANAAASAKSGMEKTTATVQEKLESMTTHDPTEKEMPTEKKEEKMSQADADKQAAHKQNAAAKEEAGSGESYSYSTTGEAGKPTGGHQMSALPGHGTGEPAGQVTEGTIRSHPIGRATGPGQPGPADHRA